MTIWDKLFPVIGLLMFMTLQAAYQAARFDLHKTVDHRLHAVWYALITVFFCWPNWIEYEWWGVLKTGSVGALLRLAFYDFILNIARSKPLFYNDSKLLGERTIQSWWDRIENKLPEKWQPVLKIVYVIGFIVAFILIQ